MMEMDREPRLDQDGHHITCIRIAYLSDPCLATDDQILLCLRTEMSQAKANQNLIISRYSRYVGKQKYV